MSARKPWHDTPLCASCKDGPLVPAYEGDGPPPREWLAVLRCCACGNHITETDPQRIAHAWWSHGAYAAKLELERV